MRPYAPPPLAAELARNVDALRALVPALAEVARQAAVLGEIAPALTELGAHARAAANLARRTPPAPSHPADGTLQRVQDLVAKLHARQLAEDRAWADLARKKR